MKRSLADFQPSLDLTGRRVKVDAESRRIAVRVASYGEVHSGFGEQVKVPRNANLDAAHVGTADLDDGSTLRVATLPMDTIHAPANLDALHAASWYEQSGKGIASGRYSSDEVGIRFDGVLFADIDDAKVERITAASASGDWRSAIALKRFSDFEHAPADFVGSCIVNIPGYSDTFRAATGRRMALAASAHTLISIEDDTMQDPAAPTTEVLVAGAADSNPDGAAALPDGCTGECSNCVCGARPVETAPVAEPTVTLSAGALMSLIDATGDQMLGTDELAEAREVLTAGGFIAAPDPAAERMSMLERAVIRLAFGD